jgi:hypothetical protein
MAHWDFTCVAVKEAAVTCLTLVSGSRPKREALGVDVASIALGFAQPIFSLLIKTESQIGVFLRQCFFKKGDDAVVVGVNTVVDSALDEFHSEVAVEAAGSIEGDNKSSCDGVVLVVVTSNG